MCSTAKLQIDFGIVEFSITISVFASEIIISSDSHLSHPSTKAMVSRDLLHFFPFLPPLVGFVGGASPTVMLKIKCLNIDC